MTPEQWASVKDLFAAALEVDAARRDSWLAASGKPPEILDEVRSLLAAHDSAGEDTMPEQPAPRAAVIAGRYELGEMVGAGGMGRVYRARDRNLGREVALKIIAVGLTGREEYLRRFEREIRALSILEHPNICRVYDAGFDEHPFLVMELLQGETLRECLQRGPLGAELAVRIALDACQGLAAAGYAGFIHRDIKPGNLFLTTGGPVKILDFGLVKRMANPAGSTSTGTQLTTPGQAPGTPSYMSPEQLRAKELDARTDIFSLGVVLYEMVTGVCPFRGAEAAEVAAAILKDIPAPPSRLNANVPAALDRIILRALEKRPEDRYSSAAEMAADLRALLPAPAAAPAPVLSRRSTIGMAAGAAAAAGAAGFYLWRNSFRPVERNRYRLVPYTGYAGRKSGPQFSPGGDRLVFTWTGEQNISHDVYLRMAGGGSALRLTNSPDPEQHPRWSRKGDYIAFRRDGGERGYYVVPPLGGPARKVADSFNVPVSILAGNFDWTPDGSSLLIADSDRPDGPLALHQVNVISGQMRLFYSGQQFVSSPVFSPDGKWLAFTEGPSFLAHDLYVMPADGSGKPRRLTHDDRWISGLCWTPSGSELVFSSSRKLLFALWRIPFAGGEPQTVPGTGTDAYAPSISPDGKRMAFVYRKNILNVWRIDLKAKPDAPGAAVKLLPSTRASMEAVYSPDGSRIAFTSDRSGAPEIWICAADGSGPRQLTQMNGPQTGSPAWSPDGAKLLFDTRVGDQAVLFVMNADGTGAQKVATGPGDAYVGAWGRDGKRIYFVSTRGGHAELWWIPSGGGEAVKVGGQDVLSGQESLDGKWIYYADRGALWRRATDGSGEEARVIDKLYWRDYAIGPGGILFAAANERSMERIQLLRPGAAAPVDVARIGPRGAKMGSISVSPDGRYLLYEQLDQVENDIYLVEDFDGNR